jgi:glycosyltransferase involved in cell wall biosynthesis
MTRDGAEGQLLKTLARLNSAEFEAFVVLSRQAGERHDRLVALPIVQGVTVLRNARQSVIEKAFTLGGIAKAVQPDVIHSWLWYSNFLCGLAHRFALLSHLPLIVSQRGDYHARYGRLRLWLTEKVIYARADVILTNAHRIADNLRARYPKRRILAIRNIIDLPDYPSPSFASLEDRLRRGEQGEVKRIVSVGRLSLEKGYRFLIEALNGLSVEFTATILGDGVLKPELCRLINQHGLSDRIGLPGFSEDVFPILSNADLFVLPSLHEGSPNALIEAMAVGLPCIASSVGGVLDLIEDGQSGLLVPSADSEALKTAIHRVLTDQTLAEHLAKNAQLKIREMFNSNTSIQELEAVYRECLQGNKERGNSEIVS